MQSVVQTLNSDGGKQQMLEHDTEEECTEDELDYNFDRSSEEVFVF